ncbi:MAG: tetratricopeptide repeat protein [Desulfosarcinaceae bacterium]|nr:tetratricopeptide repeat protein [Desulfosarcinaceae bacterium]
MGWTKKSAIFLTALIILTGCTASTAYQNREKAEANRNVGEAYLRQGNYSAAMAEFVKAEKLTPKDPYLKNDMGLVFLARKRYPEAIDYFQQAIQLKPDYAPALNNLGSAYLATRNWDAAITTFKEISNNMLYATPHYPLANLGLAYYHKGQYDLAEAAYRKALEIQPEFHLALRGLGRTYLAQGQVEPAIGALEQAVAGAPQTAAYWMDLGNAYRAGNWVNKARRAFEKVISLDPEGPLAGPAEVALTQLP